MDFKTVCAICLIAAGCITISLGQSDENSCNCGPQGIDCKYTNGAKVCSCQQGFKQNQDSCESCNCRSHFSDCNFVDGHMNCTCDAGYVQKDDLCVEACSIRKPCQNGGMCIDGKCSCKKGVAGQFCQIITACETENLCGDDPDASCLYDTVKEEAYCRCKKPSQIFVKSEQKCRVPCAEASECLYGGECLQKEEGQFCKCKPGLIGDFCEVCNRPCYEGSFCTFLPELGRLGCKCKESDELMNWSQFACRKPCESDSDCKYGGKCREGENAKFCKCKKGTSGSFCEKLRDCYLCGDGDDVTCKYNVTEEKIQCLCHDKEKIFDEVTRTCRIPCHSDSDCLHSASCSTCIDEYPFRCSEKNFCRCKEGTSGEKCQIIDKCESGEVDCGGADDVECFFDPTLSLTSCKCKGSLMGFDENDKACKECDCGTGSNYCLFHKQSGEKFCGCSAGFKQNGETCQRCDCGHFCYDCAFKDGEKICQCFSTFVQENGRCVSKE